MKYQIYLQKDVSELVNALADNFNITPSTMIKTLLESNFRNAYKDVVTLTGKEDIIDGLKDKIE